ncbi:MAG: helix-turn-helix domain-containing protein [Patescibacteria group bacterium]
MDSTMKQKLRELGFSEKEADVYLALAEIGSAVASDIAKKARIKRSTAYVILDALLERGLVNVTERRGVKLYNSTPPEQLIQHLRSMAKRYVGLADTAKKLLPELRASRKEQAPAPKVQLFEGAKGIRTVYEDTLASLEDIRVHAAFVHDASEAKYDAHKKPAVKMRLVAPDMVSGGKKAAASHRGVLRTAMAASRENADASSEINVYDGRVVCISRAEDFAVVIESRELADAFKKAFAVSAKEAKEATGNERTVARSHTVPGDLSLALG